MKKCSRTTFAVAIGFSALSLSALANTDCIGAFSGKGKQQEESSSSPKVEPRIGTKPRAVDPDKDVALLLINDQVAADAHLAQYELAEKTIYDVMFALHQDEAGLLYAANSIRQARAGKDVRKIFDYDYGNNWFTLELMELMRDNGVKIKLYHPYRLTAVQKPLAKRAGEMLPMVSEDAILKDSPLWLTKKTHEKFSVTDRSRLIVGGRNVQNAYFTSRRYRGIRFNDASVYVEGKPAEDAHEHFLNLWYSTHVQDPPWQLGQYITKEERMAIRAEVEHFIKVLDRWYGMPKSREQLLSSLNDVHSIENAHWVKDVVGKDPRAPEVIMKQLVKLIDDAQTEVIIINPYLLLTKEMRQALKGARARGVQIQIATNSPGSGDMGIVNELFASERKSVADMGIQLYQYNEKKVLHAKIIVTDRKHVAVTSANMDPRSQNLNMESGVIWDSEDDAADIVRHFEDLKTKCDLYGPELIAKEAQAEAEWKAKMGPVKTFKAKMKKRYTRTLGQVFRSQL